MKIVDLIRAGKEQGLQIRVTEKLDDRAVEYRRADNDHWLAGGYTADIIDDRFDMVAPVIADLMLDEDK